MKNYAYNIRVLPLIKRLEDGSYEDNLTNEEVKNISCEPRMLRRSRGKMFFTELPPTYHGENIKARLYYLYRELTSEEQAKYESRIIDVPVTTDKVIKLNKYKRRVKKR